MPTNYLKAVFWDYPGLADEGRLRQVLGKARREGDKRTLLWIMARFLERGRIRDTALYFSPQEIAGSFGSLKISSHARKRWERLLEVYAGHN